MVSQVIVYIDDPGTKLPATCRESVIYQKYSIYYQLSDLITQVLGSRRSWVGKQEVLKQVEFRQVLFPKAIFCQIRGWGHATELLAYSLSF